MTEEEKTYNGHLIEDLCKLGEEVAKSFFTAEQIDQDRRRIRDLQNACGVNREIWEE